MDWLSRPLSLAALRYNASIMRAEGGPIERLSARPFSLDGNTEAFEAFAQLRSGLIPSDTPGIEPVFLGPSHGTGTSTRRSLAIYIAISEALERWAGLLTTQNESICSTHGFAAYPGLTPRAPRQAAWLEVIERFCIAEFLTGERGATLLADPAETQGIEYYRVSSPEDVFVIFARARNPLTGFNYGFAARANLNLACRHARLELLRNHQHLLRAPESSKSGAGVTYFYEQKLLRFSSGEGAEKVERFLSAHRENTFKPHPIPNLKIDEAVRGPWSSWTHVWRCSLGDELTHSVMLDPHLCLF